ncbi:MAG: MerC domain-containing protein [Pseudomonadota bacterium]
MDRRQLNHHSQKWDRTGVTVASLCLLHCIGLPFLFLFLPSVQWILDNPMIEVGILGAGIIVGSIAFLGSYKEHKRKGPMILGISGVVALVIQVVMENLNHHSHVVENPSFETIEPLTAVGGLLLIAGHLWNIRTCRQFCDHDHHPGEAQPMGSTH